MNTTTLSPVTPAAAAASRTTPPMRAKLSAAGVIRSEWIKLRTVRSTLWCYGILILLIAGIGVLVASLSDVGAAGLTGDAAGSLVVGLNTVGLNIAVLIVAVLGSLIITGEYSTGMIRSTFAAVPGRTGALAAKGFVLAVSTFVATSVGIWLSVLVSTPILAGKGVDVDLADPAVFLPLLGGAVYVAMIALLAFGFGALLRNTAGALAMVLGIMLIAPLILQMLAGLVQADWVTSISTLLPQSAGGHLFAFDGGGTVAPTASGALTLNGWGGFGVLAAWDALVLASAWILVKRRDA